ncbi:type II toxin-antitoxin system VapC family toxin [uncultured Lamprocystis sp.]|jgi:PIN domain nuclease of toxin-antitoxin system|uniref:type II toxin-antitoxin system VapC family toxin n=1 Tax=uncultured Lamprocystis sp. TaxID=543132 RepID=UPI0025D652BC|nr:type II toxin-antitoxin system VapC family toxin [uncultured Lamprocystis sp.]
MILLLDTHLLLWAAGQPERLSPTAAALLLDPANALMFSAASMWEITIKNGLGRDDFQVDPRRFWRMLLTHDYRELPVRSEHTIAVKDLPPLHKDPFDRLLIAQARTEGLTLLTCDALVSCYGEPARLV